MIWSWVLHLILVTMTSLDNSYRYIILCVENLSVMRLWDGPGMSSDANSQHFSNIFGQQMGTVKKNR